MWLVGKPVHLELPAWMCVVQERGVVVGDLGKRRTHTYLMVPNQEPNVQGCFLTTFEVPKYIREDGAPRIPANACGTEPGQTTSTSSEDCPPATNCCLGPRMCIPSLSWPVSLGDGLLKLVLRTPCRDGIPAWAAESPGGPP